jgi:hypothetical protein
MGEKPTREDVNETGPPRRAPYVAPDIAWEDELGSRPGLVAVCAKVGPSNPSCEALPPGS